MLEVPRRPGFPELMLAVILLVLGFLTFPYAVTSHDNPYVDYDANAGIRVIIGTAFAIDGAMFVWIVVCAIRRSWSHASQLTLVVLCAAAIALIWLELWWGSTFYYGEVRDKQGLPYGINNAGALGSLIFATYIVWRLRFGSATGTRLAVYRAGATLAVFGLQRVALAWLEGPWKLWQS